MRRLILALLLLLIPAIADTEVAITLKDGTVFHWESYYEEDGNLCKEVYGGKICVSKPGIASIEKGEKGSLPQAKTGNIEPRFPLVEAMIEQVILVTEDKYLDAERKEAKKQQTLMDRQTERSRTVAAKEAKEAREKRAGEDFIWKISH